MHGLEFLLLFFSSAHEAYAELEVATKAVVDLTSPNGVNVNLYLVFCII